ncbi:MAG: hypothetical protein ABS79_00015 [Planctomycetes bacterium SCN 63-9]|nr:MAG: hypothetical protein ABS79_00015 [Planctomycetes bacterium SCN 63-9]
MTFFDVLLDKFDRSAASPEAKAGAREFVGYMRAQLHTDPVTAIHLEHGDVRITRKSRESCHLGLTGPRQGAVRQPPNYPVFNVGADQESREFPGATKVFNVGEG